MEIQKVIIEYDTATYIAEGADAQSWRTWMLEAEKDAKAGGKWVWNSWTKILQKTNGNQMTEGPPLPDAP